MRAIVIEQTDTGTSAALTDFPEGALMEGDVTLRVSRSTMNYKDGLALTGRAPVVRRFPMIAGIDAAGVVEASTHPAWKPGDGRPNDKLIILEDTDGDGKYDRIGFAVPAVPATGPNGSYMMWTWFPWLWQAGGWFVNEDQTEVLFDHEPGVEALSLWKDLYQMQQLRNFTNDWMIAFTSKQAAIIMDGPWNLPRYDTMLGGIDWGIGMLPEGPEKRATIVGGEFLAIFKQTEHPDAAWQFVKWVSQPEIQAWWAMESGYLPVRQSAMEIEEYQQFLAENPGHRAFAEQMEYAVAQRPLDYHSVEIQRLVAVAMEEAMVGGQDPQRALSEAARKANALLDAVDREGEMAVEGGASGDSHAGEGEKALAEAN